MCHLPTQDAQSPAPGDPIGLSKCPLTRTAAASSSALAAEILLSYNELICFQCKQERKGKNVITSNTLSKKNCNASLTVRLNSLIHLMRNIYIYIYMIKLNNIQK